MQRLEFIKLLIRSSSYWRQNRPITHIGAHLYST